MGLISAKTWDIWAGSGILGFIAANAVTIERTVHILAESASFTVAMIAIVARIRTNKRDK